MDDVLQDFRDPELAELIIGRLLQIDARWPGHLAAVLGYCEGYLLGLEEAAEQFRRGHIHLVED